MVSRFAFTALALAASLATSTSASAAGSFASISKLWSTTSTGIAGIADLPGFPGGNAATRLADYSSEISAWDPVSRTIFSAGGKGIELLNLNGSVHSSFDTTEYGEINSIAIFNGVAAVSFANAVNKGLDGTVQFFSTQTFRSSGGGTALLGGVTVGSVPDMVTWTANGTKLLVANEGERQGTVANVLGPNAAGSISIINFNSAAPGTSTVTTLGFTAWDGQEAALRASGVRIQAGISTSIALEPEYIAVSPNGLQAMVTLQENNAVALINLATNQITGIQSLGTKDFSLPGNHIDPSDRDPSGASVYTARNVPVKGLYMPDAIAAYSAGGQTFYVTANEGDAFVDDADVGRFGSADFTLDATVFNGVNKPTQAQLKPNSVLGRLNVVRTGATGDGTSTNMTEIISLGGRSFSIRDAAGNLVWDSGNELELRAADAGLVDDARSDDKGVEPEGVSIFTANGRTFAAIGLERTTRSAIALYDVTDPTSPTFEGWAETGNGSADRRAEGVTTFMDGGKLYLLVSNEGVAQGSVGDFEVLGTTVLYEITPVPEPGTYALMLAGLLGVAAVARRRRG